MLWELAEEFEEEHARVLDGTSCDLLLGVLEPLVELGRQNLICSQADDVALVFAGVGARELLAEDLVSGRRVFFREVVEERVELVERRVVEGRGCSWSDDVRGRRRGSDVDGLCLRLRRRRFDDDHLGDVLISLWRDASKLCHDLDHGRITGRRRQCLMEVCHRPNLVGRVDDSREPDEDADGESVLARRDQSCLSTLHTFDVLRIELEDLLEMLERLLVEVVLQIDVGLREELLDLAFIDLGRRRLSRRGRCVDDIKRHEWRAGAGAGARGRDAEGAHRVRVVRRELEDPSISCVRRALGTVVGVPLRELLQNANGASTLVERVERVDEDVDGRLVSRVRLERRLNTYQRPFRAVLLKIDSADIVNRLHVCRGEVDIPLHDLGELFEPSFPSQGRSRDHELLGGPDFMVESRQLFRVLNPVAGVVRVDVDHLLQGLQIAVDPASLVEHCGDGLVVRQRVAEQPELEVEVSQPQLRLDVARIYTEEELVRRDRFEEEPMRDVVVRDLVVRPSRSLRLAVSGLNIADLQEDPDVVRMLLDDLLVLLDRLLVRALLNVLLGRGGDFITIDRQCLSGCRAGTMERGTTGTTGVARRRSSSATSARRGGRASIETRSLTGQGDHALDGDQPARYGPVHSMQAPPDGNTKRYRWEPTIRQPSEKT